LRRVFLWRFETVNTGKSNPPELLLVSEKEAARLLGVSPAMLTARRFKRQPLMPFVRIGKRSIRYKLSEIHEFVERSTLRKDA
jgi:hypothetical protein